MAHYAMLRDYRFAADADDIRGAQVWSDDEKLGKVKDIIFDHHSGEIFYLVVNVDDRRMLLPSSEVYRALTNEDDFQTTLTKDEAKELPEFSEDMLDSDENWKEYQRVSRAFWEERREAEEEFEEDWEEGPVQHQEGSDRNITPPEVATEPGITGAPASGGADLTPRRLAGKFPLPAQGRIIPQAAPDPTLRPAGTAAEAEDAARSVIPPSVRWRSFSETLRRELPQIRRACRVCRDYRAA